LSFASFAVNMLFMKEALIAWPTTGQRPSLLQSMDSFAQNFARYGHAPRFLAASDSDGPGLSPENAAGIKALQKKHGIKVELSNLHGRRAMLKALPAKLEPDLLAYALLPNRDEPGYGVNVNMAMLLGAGGLLVSTDDDIICNTAYSPRQKEADIEQLYYKDRPSLLASVNKTELDVLCTYKDSLGQTEKGLVLIASPGIYGDSGMGSARGALALDGASREALMQDSYKDLRLSRELVRIPGQKSVSKMATLMMTQSALFNKTPIPPLLPVGRNSDGACGLLTRLVYPHSFTAFLDFGLYHAAQGRAFSSVNSLHVFKPGITDIFMPCAIGYGPKAEPEATEERFIAIGQMYCALAGLKNADFVEHAHAAFSGQYSHIVQLLQSLLDKFERKPELWAEDADIHIASINEIFREPKRLFGQHGCGFSIERVKYHMDLYGRLLQAWPEIWRHFASREFSPNYID